MIIPLDRQKRLTLLKWLKNGSIDTLDIPEAYKDGTLFMEIIKESSIQAEPQDTAEACKTDKGTE